MKQTLTLVLITAVSAAQSETNKLMERIDRSKATKPEFVNKELHAQAQLAW